EFAGTACITPVRPGPRRGRAPLLPLHPIDVVRARKGARAYVGRIARDRRLDRGSELAVAADEFRHTRRQAEHVLQHENLAVAGCARPDADGPDRQLAADPRRQRLRPPPHPHPPSPALHAPAPASPSRAPLSSPAPPWARNEPMVLIACGVRPTWPMTGTPRSTRNAMVSAMRRPPSSFTAPQPVSFITRAQLAKACSREA